MNRAPDESAFVCANGSRLHTLSDLAVYLEKIDISEFSHHVTQTNNDFANWIEHVFSNRFLANTLRALKTSQQMALALQVTLQPLKQREFVREAVHAKRQKSQTEAASLLSTFGHTPPVTRHVSEVRQPVQTEPTYDVHSHIKHLETELSHLLKYHKQHYEPVHEVADTDVRARLLDFLFGMCVGMTIGLILARLMGF